TPAAARPVRWICSASANSPPCSSPTDRLAAGSRHPGRTARTGRNTELPWVASPLSASSASASRNRTGGRTAGRARRRSAWGGPRGGGEGWRPWSPSFPGGLQDRGWPKRGEALYRRYARWEKYLRNERPLARLGLVYSQQSAWFHGARVEDHTLGWYQALIEARIPFEMVHDRLLDDVHLGGFRTLILPNTAALSYGQYRQLREFVNRGGTLIGTYEPSLYDEWGVRRKDFGLADLFGVTFKGRVEGPMQNSYLRLESDPASGRRHPLLAGLEDAPRIINGVHRVEVEATRPFPQPPLTLIPSYPDLAMEKVYPRVPKTDVPQVFLRELGRARIVYFPWDIDQTFWEVLAVDHLKLLHNAVTWATDEEPVITVTGPGVLDVTVWQQK